jgi:hypothetical protein
MTIVGIDNSSPINLRVGDSTATAVGSTWTIQANKAIIAVFVNGLKMTAGVDYTVSGTVITPKADWGTAPLVTVSYLY